MAILQVLFVLDKEFCSDQDTDGIMSLARVNQVNSHRTKNNTSTASSGGVDVVVDVDLAKGTDHEESKVSADASSGPSTILKTGMLYKKGGVTGAMYNPRLFELRSDGQLNYYIIDITGKRVQKGGIKLTATTKIEKRGGGRKREAKFIIHHPLEDKEWYLWCHKPKLPQPIIDFKPGSDKNPFVNFANSLKNDQEKEKALKSKKKENKMSTDSKHKSQGNRNGIKSGKTLHSKGGGGGGGGSHKMNGNGKKANSGNAMWPFQYLSNLNHGNKGHSPPPSTDAWNPKPSLKHEPKGTVTVDNSDDDSDDGKEEEKGGRQEAEEWCKLLNEVGVSLYIYSMVYTALCIPTI